MTATATPAFTDKHKANAEQITGRKWDTLTHAQQANPLGYLPDGGPLPPGATSLVDHDFWGTPANVAEAIVDVLGPRIVRRKSRDDMDGTPYLIEPTAGYGAFIGPLQRYLARAMEQRVPVPPLEHNLVALDDAHACYTHLSETFPGVDVMEADFLEAAQDVSFWGTNNVAVGNPPFRQARDLQFVEACKRVCCRFALILPLTLLEPCENRSWTVQTARYRTFRQGLHTVYPIRRVSFVNLLGGPSTAGKRPVGVYYYERPPRDSWNVTNPGNVTLNYSIQDRLDAQDGAGECQGE